MKLPFPLVDQSRLDRWRARRWRWNTGRSGPGEPRMSPTREQRLEQFNSTIYYEVEGWLGNRVAQVISLIGTIFDQNGVRGNIAEFGVHHGLFLFLLNALRNDDEECSKSECGSLWVVAGEAIQRRIWLASDVSFPS